MSEPSDQNHGPSEKATLDYAPHPNVGQPVGLARETTRNAILMMIARLSSLFISVGSIFFFTRILNKDEYAFWGVITLIGQTCIIFTDLGLGLSVDRWLPAYAETDPVAGRTISRVYLYATGMATVAFCVGLVALARPLEQWLLEGKFGPRVIYLSIPYVLGVVGHQIMTIILRGLRRYDRLSWCIPLNQVMFTLAGVALYFPFGIYGFILGNGLGQFPALLYFSRPIWKYLMGLPSVREFAHFLKQAWPYHAERYLNFCLYQADQWMVAGLFTNQVKSTYNVPRTFFDRITGTLDGLTSVPMTAMAAASSRNPESLIRGIVIMRRALLYVFALMCASLMAGSRFLVDILAGAKYAEGALWPFRFLDVVLFITGVFVIQAQAVYAAGHPVHRLKSVIFQNVVYLACLPLLTRAFALNGVTLARVVGALATGLAAIYFLRRIVVVRTDWQAIRVITPPCAVLLLVAFVGQAFYYSRLVAPLWLLLAGLVGVVMFLRRIPADDLQTLENILPRKLTPFLQFGHRLRGTARSDPTATKG